MPLHDYRCPVHGLFESFEDCCKTAGCQEPVKQVFLKPVGTVSARTRGIDRDLRANMEAFGMTNLASAREGDNHAVHMPSSVPWREPEPPSKMPDTIKWGAHEKLNSSTVLGGSQYQYAGPAPASPVRQFSVLQKKTVITHVAPKPIVKTAQGLAE